MLDHIFVPKLYFFLLHDFFWNYADPFVCGEYNKMFDNYGQWSEWVFVQLTDTSNCTVDHISNAIQWVCR